MLVDTEGVDTGAVSVAETVDTVVGGEGALGSGSAAASIRTASTLAAEDGIAVLTSETLIVGGTLGALGVNTEGSDTRAISVSETADAGSSGEVALGGRTTAASIRAASRSAAEDVVTVVSSTALGVR